MATRLLKLATMLGKVESPEGTDATPAAAEGFYALITPPDPQVDFYVPNVHTGKGSQLPGVIGARRFEGQAEVLLRGSGVAYSASVKPKADALLRACGLAAANTATPGSEKWDYTLRSSAFESFSFYVYLDGVITKLLGARALGSFTFPVGAPARLSAGLRALYTAPADGATVVPTGEPTIAFPVMLASAFQIAAANYAAKHGEIRLDLGRRIVPRGDGTSATGYAGMEMVAERTPVITFEAEATTEAGYPWFATLLAGTQIDCSFTVGATQYNKVTVTIPAMQFARLETFDKEGILMYRATCNLCDPAGGDADLTISFA
jgi:hypothetical protein